MVFGYTVFSTTMAALQFLTEPPSPTAALIELVSTLIPPQAGECHAEVQHTPVIETILHTRSRNVALPAGNDFDRRAGIHRVE